MVKSTHTLLRESEAGVTVEFVAVMTTFTLLTFFVMEVAIGIFWIGSAEKAAQLGARLAVVSNWAATPAPANNALTSASYAYGQSCTSAGGPCVPFTTVTCTGSSTNCTCTGGNGTACSKSDFNYIAQRMSNMFGALSNHNEYVTITYAWAGLGFAGGPVIPRVTVKLSSVPYDSLLTTIFQKVSRSQVATLPTISVTLTGEDLSTAGAS